MLSLYLGVGLIWIFEGNIFLVMVGWFITGLGGGTVYMIKGLMKGSKSIHANSSKAVESYGHVVGLAIAFCVAVIGPNLALMYIFSVFFGIMVILLSLFMAIREGGEKYADN